MSFGSLPEERESVIALGWRSRITGFVPAFRNSVRRILHPEMAKVPGLEMFSGANFG
jgi:hypothetical protein